MRNKWQKIQTRYSRQLNPKSVCASPPSRRRLYPDFLACLHGSGDGKLRFTVLETKGLHLKGNDDTNYKARLFELFTKHSESELKLGFQQQHIRFELMLETDWRDKLPGALTVSQSTQHGH